MGVLSSRPALMLRSVLRKMGVTRAIVRFQERELNREFARIKDEYRKTKPPTARAEAAGASVELLVNDETEYMRVMTYKRDLHLISPLCEASRNGGVFWDIGANFGLYSYLAAKQPGCKHVVCFDPDPWCVERLKKNAVKNDVSHVTFVAAGVSDHKGKMHFEMAGESVGGTNHLIEGPVDTSNPRIIEVPINSGDALATEMSLPSPTCIKVDVEGFEWEVIQGLRETLKAPTCKLIVVEVHFSVLTARKITNAARKIEDFLRDRGFAISWLDPSHVCGRK